MKLGEALLKRSDLQKRLQSLKSRLAANALVQEQEKPAEEPEALLEEAQRLLGAFEDMVLRINQANTTGALADGTALTAALAHRDTLLLRHGLLGHLLETASGKEQRYSFREIRWVPSIDIAAMQKRMDEVARQIRDLNIAIQEANWRIEV